jgi:glycosyltransferase involved in cell wall biosynthesis
VSGGIWPIAGANDPDAFAAGMDAMALDPAARHAAIHAGLERAAEFTWERTARLTAEFFQRVTG